MIKNQPPRQAPQQQPLYAPAASIPTDGSLLLPGKTPVSFSFMESINKWTGGKQVKLLCLNNRPICEFTHWAFYCCGAVELSNLKSHTYGTPRLYRSVNDKTQGYYDNVWTNLQLFDEFHEQLFVWLESNSPDQWRPGEFYMLIAPYQAMSLKKMLAHPKVRMVDQFRNKSHGNVPLGLYRISLTKDWTFHDRANVPKPA